jgi:hypothetical protein
MLSVVIKKEIEKRYGRTIRYPRDCEALASEIASVCNEGLSASTLKRLYGFNKGTEEPRLSTLDIIATYLGCKNWDSLLDKHSNIEYSEFTKIEELSVETLQAGDKIEFKYEPKKTVLIKYIGNCTFEVISSENSKLQSGDYFKALNFVLNYPLYILEVFRNKSELGQYKAGKVSGLTSIKKI